MKYLHGFLAAALTTISLVGCTTPSHGLVTKDMGSDEARIKLGSADGIANGGRVVFVSEDCAYHPAADATSCDRDKAGGGVVIQVVGPHEAVVRLDSGVTVEPGMVVHPAVAH